MADTLEDLAARCESATGPDRELDLLITQQFDPEYAAIWPENFKSYIKYGKHPAYTASLDAAMTLVPDGWFRRLDDLGADGLPLAMLYAPGEPTHVGTGRDLTLSLCAAALRAIAKERG